MRKIIILQSLIILVGAYYIYTLQQDRFAAERESSTSQSAEPSESITTEEETTAASESAITSSIETESSSEISGASDIGMEFPIPDDESELQVR